DQERDYFMQRYHDVISSFGGKTSYDADNRPLLVMRSNLWASGYDVDEIGRAVQQECRDRLRMPSSARKKKNQQQGHAETHQRLNDPRSITQRETLLQLHCELWLVHLPR